MYYIILITVNEKIFSFQKMKKVFNKLTKPKSIAISFPKMLMIKQHLLDRDRWRSIQRETHVMTLLIGCSHSYILVMGTSMYGKLGVRSKIIFKR